MKRNKVCNINKLFKSIIIIIIIKSFIIPHTIIIDILIMYYHWIGISLNKISRYTRLRLTGQHSHFVFVWGKKETKRIILKTRRRVGIGFGWGLGIRWRMEDN